MPDVNSCNCISSFDLVLPVGMLSSCMNRVTGCVLLGGGIQLLIFSGLSQWSWAEGLQDSQRDSREG